MPLEVSVEGFTGPLDLLCSLVESRQMQASKIKISQLVKIYGAYLSHTQNASAEVMAEFFFMAARILLQKVLSLLPSDVPDYIEEDDADPGISEEELLSRLSRFHPYREATVWLQNARARQQRRFRRIAQSEPDAPIYELGDLYSLCKLWWQLLAQAEKRREQAFNEIFSDEGEWDGIPESVPDEARIQNRIEEIEEKLRISPHISLSSLIISKSVQILVVTLLALLEMCRMRKISISQEEPFGEVGIHSIIGDGVTN